MLISTRYRYKEDNESPSARKQKIRVMFDSIVPTYDFLNMLLSAGIDRGWRKKLAALAVPREEKKYRKKILDLCCGTGGLSSLLHGGEVYSLDFSLAMLTHGRKAGSLGALTCAGDAGRLPVKDASMDILTIAFGIRNIPDMDVFIGECARVLAPAGKMYILELTRPDSLFIGLLYGFYLRVVLPVVGGIISRKFSAYRYLAGTIQTFPGAEQLRSRFLSQNFSSVDIIPLSGGIASILICSKES